ncbi:MAG: hypothetical protein QXO51_00810 [Halobacteria archaeon]
MALLDPGPLATFLFGGLAVAAVLHYYTIFRHSFHLRKARAFLHYKGYEPIIVTIGLALLGATAILLYTLVADPEALEVYDAVVYMSLQTLLATGLFYTFIVGRKAGKQ